MKNKFIVVINDSSRGIHYEVWNTPEDKSREYIYADFYGKNSFRYAKSHAAALNALPEEDQP